VVDSLEILFIYFLISSLLNTVSPLHYSQGLGMLIKRASRYIFDYINHALPSSFS